ncbi:MAG: UvrD-helicase domain-containing protein, partial [Chitinispirillaceae bacterium]|nr:UvrD-helicase domain-containing protein [Chitinispirillaceae bacterium]
TGVLQWEIFKRIFLEELDNKHSPKLFIVGDPKQSIYSFQNAVVESYLDACEIINKSSLSQQYNLIENYRTVERLIEAYNILFTHGNNNFFNSEHIKYEKINLVQVPTCHKNIKITDSSNPFFEKPLQIVPIYGKKYQRILQYSLFIVDTIKKLHGTSVRIPDGSSWKTTNLDYNHFAVIAENHNTADIILKLLHENNIPATKYKQEGIFSSKMAIQFRILLNTIKNNVTDFSTKIKSFLTDFFGYKPEEITPETIPKIEENVNILLSKWNILAKKQEWPLLFRSILDESDIKERLIRVNNGERYLSDLRQIIDYSLEMLLTKKYTFDELIEHLFALSEGYETVSGDINIYAKESDKNKVQVMTIHASKGLEFPICFVATANNISLRGRTNRWVDRIEETDENSRRCIYILPSEVNKISIYKEIVEEKRRIIKEQEEREKRRLLYVAITRAKLLLFVPMHLDIPKEEGQKWKECISYYSSETILTPLLMEIADLVEEGESPYAEYIGISKVDPYSRLKRNSPQIIKEDFSSTFDENTLKQIEKNIIEAIKKIDITSRKTVLTSYTAIAHRDRIEIDKIMEEQSDEQHNISKVKELKKEEFMLPYGVQTGIAFHKIIETILSLENWNEKLSNFQNIPEFVENIKLIIDNNGIFRDFPEEKKLLIVEKILKIVRSALFCEYNLPENLSFSISNLNCKDFDTEVEFNIADGAERLIGYIDLLFRIKENNGEYKYYILDWKSNYLEDYSPKVIEEDIKNSLYDIQAKIYCYGLHRWLSLILGKKYNPAIHLGGALYVYLRGFETVNTIQPCWFYKADPVNDEEFFKSEIKNFIKKSNYVLQN